MTTDQLKKEAKENHLECESLKKNITAQALANNPVDSMYARLNYLTTRNKEIECHLAETSPSRNGEPDTQMEKAISIASGGGGVSIRPVEDNSEEPSKKTGSAPGNKIAPVMQEAKY